VRDTGIGIAPEDRLRIFEPYTQVDQSATRRHSGAGLGLAICRELTERMGGRIWVESEPGGGSRFHFTVRFALAPAEGPGGALPRLAPTRGGHSGSPRYEHVPADMDQWPAAERALRVLLAEDTPANQKVATAILAKRGHGVDIARNGAEAVEMVQKSCYDVVLMDVQMPVLDGLQATTAIRRLEPPEQAHVPIVAMTAHVMRVDRERCLEVGMDGYISKPVDAGKLIRVVEKVAARKSRPAVGVAETVRESIMDSALFSAIRDDDGTSLAGENEKPEESPMPRLPRGGFDRAAILKRLGGNDKLLRDLMRFCEEDTPVLLTDIREGMSEGNAERITRAAHTLQGMAANFNAEAAIAAAMRMQLIARSGRLERAPAALVDLEHEFSQLRATLAQEQSC
jgi:CheY-like chemotaxis protein/HPt (histidine-containing phosphotransfer) domain-containing protein